MYETWYEGYMQLIRRWLVSPIEFFPQFPSLPNLHQQWVTLYIACLRSVEVLEEAIRKIKSSSTWQYAALRVGVNRPHLLDQIEAVLPA